MRSPIEVSAYRHGRARPGHPRLFCSSRIKTWMPGTRPGMTAEGLMFVGVERRRFAAAQYDVPAEAQRPIRNRVLQIERRHHAIARLLVRHRIEDGIERKQV